MALGPVIATSLAPPWTITVLKTDNTALDLTGATFTGSLKHTERKITKALTTGNFTISSATNGIYIYQPVAGDVDTPGTWEFETIATISSLPYIWRLPLVILPLRT